MQVEAEQLSPEYDPFSQLCHDDPYPTYAWLRRHAPLYHNPARSFWALSRFDDVQAALRDWQTFSSEQGNDIDPVGTQFGVGNFIDLDPPRHDELRGVVRGRFTPKAVRGLERHVHRLVTRLVARLSQSRSADLVAEFARPLHVELISDLLGIPNRDRPMLTDLFVRTMARTVGKAEIPEVSREASAELRDYLRRALADRRRRPREDLLTQVALAEVNGEFLGEEAVGICFQLFAGVVDTPANFLANALGLLAAHPDQRARLASNPSLIPNAVEELMRYESPEQNVARVTTREVRIHEGVIHEGERVVLILASANRDERRFRDADRLDVVRELPRHVAFGEGIHFCLGAPLARMVGRVALEVFLGAIPDYQLGSAPRRIAKQSSWGFSYLPVEWGSGQARPVLRRG